MVDDNLPNNDWILVIDDDPAAQELLTRTLTRQGYKVEVAVNGAKGLQAAKDRHPVVITLDIDMPDMNGWAVLAALKADPELAKVPVVMISTHDERARGIGAGAFDYLVKPVDRSRLIALLHGLAAPGAKPTNTPATPPSAADVAEPIRVLVVEDDPSNRELLVRMLQKEGWSVSEAETGRAGIDIAAKVELDLILLDLGLPELDGFGFLRELQELPNGSQIPVVVVSAKNLSLEERSSLKVSASKVFQKGSYSRPELLSCLRGCLTVKSLKPTLPAAV